MVQQRWARVAVSVVITAALVGAAFAADGIAGISLGLACAAFVVPAWVLTARRPSAPGGGGGGSRIALPHRPVEEPEDDQLAA